MPKKRYQTPPGYQPVNPEKHLEEKIPGKNFKIMSFNPDKHDDNINLEPNFASQWQRKQVNIPENRKHGYKIKPGEEPAFKPTIKKKEQKHTNLENGYKLNPWEGRNEIFNYPKDKNFNNFP